MYIWSDDCNSILNETYLMLLGAYNTRLDEKNI